jgi:predicted enzyme related to lactoylglutathione lyase
MKRMSPQASTYNTVDVPSVDEFVRKITENGGKVIVPKFAVPGVGYMAYCADTEGNVFGIMEEDTSAK